MIFLFLLIGLNISCDQITKNEVRENIQKNEVINILDSNLILTNVENTGAAMSLGSEFPSFLKIFFLQIFPLLLIFGLIALLVKSPNLTKIQQFAFACIIGGGIGNLMDRIKFNSVTDFMLIEMGPFKTGIFNMADVSITLGALIILICTLGENRFKLGKASI